ncbi:aminotransferase class I/II-fold pyridoxal phosphate-dependent enzyme [Alloalcanivorax gelatiniphagus]|uniref:Aminotransferase n=1 Tax=Alloalcanivorax gelatiniphagus TaxID=1194167 RepID=A0ABY2XR32_9GAMM|nr:aminotransferase class I/II-fold pyridoxal phosphate-dependent enzyme [Alloalcanivorax gelatiniphagus]TMW15360.1 aminotransferase class I/II-fold pyridoxal phosphate-dependent enzyme [Alloalcanivorax gelatiniphagus]
MALLERAQALQAAGRDILHLEVGEPDFPCPAPIMAAAGDALARGDTRYTPAAGLPALREAIALDYRRRLGAPVTADQVVVTPGASGALQLVMTALLNPGDEALLCDPGYPCNRQFVTLAGGVPRPLTLDPAEQFRLSHQRLAASWGERTRLAMVASPDNPTGNRLDTAELAAMARWCAERRGTLVVDEIYQGLCYDAPADTVLRHGDQAVVINSFSKYFGMTGWRLGWLVAPRALVPAIERLAQNWFLAPATVAQHAALAAFDEETLLIAEQRRQLLDRRRTLLKEALPALGLPVVGGAEGAFYLYVDVSAHTDDSFAFCQDLLEEAGVALTPGLDFGADHHPERYLRLAYTCDEDRLREALRRLADYLGRP